MRLLDLFSGIGGFSLATQWVWGDELEIVAFCEIDKFCQKVLKKHWPNVPIIEDVRDVKGTEWTETINILTGGEPCQPHSTAGKRRCKKDDRYLWPEMFRIIQEIRPVWVVNENVAGSLFNGVVDDKYNDLEGIGYALAPPFIIPACTFGAIHRRDRVFICANINGGSGGPQQKQQQENLSKINDRVCPEVVWYREWKNQPCLGRRVHGLSNRVDRLKSLGNAIVPQVAYQIMKAIKEIENNMEKKCP